MSDWNSKIIAYFRANDGKVGGYFANTPLLLLHHIGAKTGQPRVNPLAYIVDADRYVVVASKGGAPSNPYWNSNVIKHPEVQFEVGTETFQAAAAACVEPERSELYAKMSTVNPGFADYAAKTTRVIPVVVLTRTR